MSPRSPIYLWDLEDEELTNFDPFSDIKTSEENEFGIITTDSERNVEPYSVETSSSLIPYGKKAGESSNGA